MSGECEKCGEHCLDCNCNKVTHCQECKLPCDFDKEMSGSCSTCKKKYLCYACCYTHECLLGKARHLCIITNPQWICNLRKILDEDRQKDSDSDKT